MKFKIDYKVGDYFSGVLLETFKEKGISRPRVRPVEMFSKNIRVEFPRRLREENPIGTQFRASVKVAHKTSKKTGKIIGVPYLMATSSSIKLVSNYSSIAKDLQKKLDQYINKRHSDSEIGKFYERQIRYLYEKDGWRVVPYGILKGKSDLGRDLICTKGRQVLIIQAKNWSKYSTIREKHIMQLAGTMLYYIFKNNKFPKGVFITTTKLSDRAKDVAKKLHIQHRYIELNKKFPMIKCNINRKGKKLFFLPFDKFYDHVHVEKDKGEFYTNSISECLRKGFRYVGKK